MNTNNMPVKNEEKKTKPVYRPKPMTPQTAVNDDISKFFTEDDR